jgi:predicted transcriptional regulator
MNDRKIMRVRDVMNTQFEAIDGMASVSDALALMCRSEAKCLIVEKRNEDDEYGLLLVSDIARHVLAKDRAPERVNVYEICAKPVISVDPQMDIRYCARLFTQFDLSRAPVVENGKVIGIVSFSHMVLGGLCQI